MAGAVKHAKLESRTARSRLKRGRQPHWQALVPGKVHLGYQCWKGDAVGRWVLRRYVGDNKYRTAAFAVSRRCCSNVATAAAWGRALSTGVL